MQLGVSILTEKDFFQLLFVSLQIHQVTYHFDSPIYDNMLS